MTCREWYVWACRTQQTVLLVGAPWWSWWTPRFNQHQVRHEIPDFPGGDVVEGIFDRPRAACAQLLAMPNQKVFPCAQRSLLEQWQTLGVQHGATSFVFSKHPYYQHLPPVLPTWECTVLVLKRLRSFLVGKLWEEEKIDEKRFCNDNKGSDLALLVLMLRGSILRQQMEQMAGLGLVLGILDLVRVVMMCSP